MTAALLRRGVAADRLGAVGVLGLGVALWWMVSSQGWISRVFLPTPDAAWRSLVDGFTSPADGSSPPLPRATLATVVRMLEGWLLASLAGVVLGAAIGVLPTLRRVVQPTLEFLRPLPASALLPLAISIFGLSPSMVLAVVAFGAMWPVLLATIHGFAHVEPGLAEVARGLQLGRAAFVWKVGLPSAMPDILAGVRLAMTVSLIVAVVGEMIASQAGLGTQILLASRSFRSSELFAGIALLGAIGFLTNALLALAERRLLRWQPS